MPRHHHLKAGPRFVFCKREGIETWVCVSHTTSTCIVQELRDKDTLAVVHLREPSRAQSDSFQNADFLGVAEFLISTYRALFCSLLVYDAAIDNNRECYLPSFMCA